MRESLSCTGRMSVIWAVGRVPTTPPKRRIAGYWAAPIRPGGLRHAAGCALCITSEFPVTREQSLLRSGSSRRLLIGRRRVLIPGSLRKTAICGTVVPSQGCSGFTQIGYEARRHSVDPSSLVLNRFATESIDAKRLAPTLGLSRPLSTNQCPWLIPTRWQSLTHTRCRGHCEYACGEKRNTSAQRFPFAAVCLWTCPR
jgi:hypothetical protein